MEKSKGYQLYQKIYEIEPHKKDLIDFRIKFIEYLLSEGYLKPMFDLDNVETENFTKVKNDQNPLNKKYINFRKAVSSLGGRLDYVKSGTTGHTFKGIINSSNGEINYAMKVVSYTKKEKYGGIHVISRPENAELRMIKLLSYFVINHQTPHLVLPFATFNTNIKNFVTLIESQYVLPDDKKYVEFVDRYKRGEFHKQVSILISEWANNGDLLDFLRNNAENKELLTTRFFKVIFFQLLSVLAIIQDKYPAFRHNDLKANNVLLHKTNIVKPIRQYYINNTIYGVPNIGYEIKLWDFDFASIDGLIENAKVEAEWTSTMCNVTSKKNLYYDMHYFFNSLIKKGFFPQLMKEDFIGQEIKDFINRIVPKKYQDGKYVHRKGRIAVDVEYLTPDQVLKTDIFFKEFRDIGMEIQEAQRNTYQGRNKEERLQRQDKGNKATFIEEERLQRRDKEERLRRRDQNKTKTKKSRDSAKIKDSSVKDNKYVKQILSILLNDDIINNKELFNSELSRIK